MATETICEYCNATIQGHATLMHTEQENGLWVLDCSMCADCSKSMKGVLDKVKRQKSWAGWAEAEGEVRKLRQEVVSLRRDLEFLTHEDATCDGPKGLLYADPFNEVVEVTAKFPDESKGKGGKVVGDPIRVHRSVLIKTSKSFKSKIVSNEFRGRNPVYDAKKHRHGPMDVPKIFLTKHILEEDKFLAFIKFLNTAQLSPETLKDHAPDLMRAGNEFQIELLKSKCEEYMVGNMTQPSTVIDYLKVATECGSTAVKEAAVEQIHKNKKVYSAAMLKDIPGALELFWEYFRTPQPAVEPAANTEATSSGRNDGARASSAYAVQSYGFCTCQVHPFAHAAHSAALGPVDDGVHFSKVSFQPSMVNFVRPPTSAEPDA